MLTERFRKTFFAGTSPKCRVVKLRGCEHLVYKAITMFGGCTILRAYTSSANDTEAYAFKADDGSVYSMKRQGEVWTISYHKEKFAALR